MEENKTLPYELEISGGLEAGKFIKVKGRPTARKQFEISLCAGTFSEGKIAFNLVPRLNKGLVACNTKVKNRWGKEEHYKEGFPFIPNHDFEIVIMVLTDRFKVYVDDEPLLEYNYRVKNLSSIDTLCVKGSLELYDAYVYTEEKPESSRTKKGLVVPCFLCCF